MESSMRFSQPPPLPPDPPPSNGASPHFTIKPLTSVASPLFSLKNSNPPPKDTHYFNRS